MYVSWQREDMTTHLQVRDCFPSHPESEDVEMLRGGETKSWVAMALSGHNKIDLREVDNHLEFISGPSALLKSYRHLTRPLE